MFSAVRTSEPPEPAVSWKESGELINSKAYSCLSQIDDCGEHLIRPVDMANLFSHVKRVVNE